MNASNTKELVVDANILIHSRGQFPFKKAFVPPSVVEEVNSEMAQMKMQKVEIEPVRPSENSLEKVKEKSEDINSPTSSQDEEALALAIDKQLTLVTDDKALQNLALHLGADFQGFNTDGVDGKREWKKICGNCSAEVSSPPCSRCGSRSLDRKRVQNS